eukprot:8791151-Prorocentrum_lima.AAC.1
MHVHVYTHALPQPDPPVLCTATARSSCPCCELAGFLSIERRVGQPSGLHLAGMGWGAVAH